MRANDAIRFAVADGLVEASNNSTTEIVSVACSNSPLRALEDARRLGVCMCNVGGSVFLHARVARTLEEAYHRVARRPLRYGLQRDSHGRE